ncbi:serine hydrolase domain-containing protein [Streptomyces sp. H27-S2]|uniref:serine hydrolase domain-containing protein n=1 Tax=Streptomyces antarcticus TaxID=2996458 RepID=UPI00227087C7|nr:serine hydrolase domain-containing protein [Streptomyces sp. H27-S2]MCY0953101.1 serine hydrolase [Streptomyces sp. H27-S2]
MDQELGTLVQQTADQLADRRVGVVVAALAGDHVEIRGAGTTGGAHAHAPGPDTLFEIGSVTKAFTALALARLTVTGETDLDEPLSDLLPEGAAVPSRGGERITLRHLGTHTSGLPRLPRGMLLTALLRPGKPDPYAHCSTEWLMAGLARTRLGAVPGARFRYSNLGAGLLGLALARRAGTDYESLVTRTICTPLGMGDTVVSVDAARTRRSARGHDRRGRPTPPWHLADLTGAGGLRSTATDLAAFVRAQLDGGPEPLAAAIRLSREVEHRKSPFAWAHLGWMAHRLHPRQGAHLQIWHNGGTGGFSSFVAFDPEKRLGVIALGNTSRPVDRPAFDLLRSLQTQHGSAAPR